MINLLHEKNVTIITLLLLFICSTPIEAAENSDFLNISGNSSISIWRVKNLNSEITNNSLNTFQVKIIGEREYNSKSFSWLAIYNNALIAGGLVKSPEFKSLLTTPQQTYADFFGKVSSKSYYHWNHHFSRASLQFENNNGRLVFGRQRISLGTARVWNPSDRFNPTLPFWVNGIQKTGIDALFIERFYGSFGALQLTAAPKNNSRGAIQKLSLRWRDTVGQADYSVLFGKIGDEIMYAGDVSANFLGGNIYFELNNGRPENADNYIQFSTGYETILTSNFLASYITVGIEYFRNMDADGNIPSVSVNDRLQTRRRDFLSLLAGYDITELFRISGIALFDTETGSTAFLPTFNWSLSQDLDLEILGQFYHGGKESEFGNNQNSILLRISSYF